MSRLSGGKIGNKSIWDEITMSGPVGISFVDNQLAREAGVNGMKPMSEGELAEYIRMWLESIGVVAHQMDMPEVLQEMQRVGEALTDARTKYMASKRAGVEVSGDVVEILDELETAFEELSIIKESLKKDQEKEMLEEMELRKQLGLIADKPENAAMRAPLVERLKQLVALRKNAEAKVAEGTAVRQAQDLARQSLEQQWIAYLTGLLDELQINRERFDPDNAKESFRQLLGQYISAFQAGANENVTKYLTILRSVMAPITDPQNLSPDYSALNQLVMESGSNPAFQALLRDIRGYYGQAWQWKAQAVQALNWGKELLRKLQAHVQGVDIDSIGDVGTLFEVLGRTAEGLATRVNDLEAQLAAVTTELSNSQAMVLTQSEAAKEYRAALEQIKTRLMPNATEQITPDNVNAFVQALLAAVENVSKSSGEAGQRVIQDMINQILKPYLEFLQDYVVRLQNEEDYTPEQITQIMSMFDVWDGINKSQASPELKDTLGKLLTVMGNTARSLLSYANTMIGGKRFFEEASKIVEQSNATPESVIAAIHAIRGTLADQSEIAKQDAERVNKLTAYMQDLAQQNQALMSNMDLLRQQSEAELQNARAQVEELKAQLKSGNDRAAAELAKLQQQLAISQRELEVAKKMREQKPLDLKGVFVDPERMDDVDPLTQYRAALQAMATTLQMQKMNPQADSMRMIWLAFRMTASGVQNASDAIQMGMDTLAIYQRLPLPTYNTRSYGLYFMGCFIDMLFSVSTAFHVPKTGSTPTDPRAWTRFVDTASDLWYQMFVERPVGYLSMSVAARFAILGNNRLISMLEKGELVDRYNSSIQSICTLNSKSQTSGNAARLLSLPQDLSIVMTWLQDIAYNGGIPDVPDFIFAYYILSRFQAYAADEFRAWVDAAKTFCLGSEEGGLPLGRFLLTTNPNEGKNLVTSGLRFLAAETIYSSTDEVARAALEFENVQSYGAKWQIKS